MVEQGSWNDILRNPNLCPVLAIIMIPMAIVAVTFIIAYFVYRHQENKKKIVQEAVRMGFKIADVHDLMNR